MLIALLEEELKFSKSTKNETKHVLVRIAFGGVHDGGTGSGVFNGNSRG